MRPLEVKKRNLDVGFYDGTLCISVVSLVNQLKSAEAKPTLYGKFVVSASSLSGGFSCGKVRYYLKIFGSMLWDMLSKARCKIITSN